MTHTEASTMHVEQTFLTGGYFFLHTTNYLILMSHSKTHISTNPKTPKLVLDVFFV